VHTFKAGLDFRRLRMDRAGANVPRGQFTFNGELTGNPIADFLIGYAAQSQSPEGILPVQFRQQTYAGYFQDEWKATRKLTLSLGIRYDYVSPTVEKNGIQRALRLDRPGGYLYPETSAPITGREPVPLYRAEKTRFWPRFGLAYRPAQRWVVRAGFGVYNNANQMNNLTVFSDPERRASNNYSGVRRTTSRIPIRFRPPVRARSRRQCGLRCARSRERLQRAVERVRATAAFRVHGDRVGLCRQPDLAPGQQPQSQRCPSRIGAATGQSPVSDLGHHPIPGGRRQVLLSIDAGPRRARVQQEYLLPDQLYLGTQHRSGVRNQRIAAVHAGGVQNQNCFACERANSGFDYRHRFTTSFLWNIPTPAGWKGPLAYAIKNWSFNGIVTYQSGFPFT
jgi:hypothetical protein